MTKTVYIVGATYNTGDYTFKHNTCAFLDRKEAEDLLERLQAHDDNPYNTWWIEEIPLLG